MKTLKTKTESKPGLGAFRCASQDNENLPSTSQQSKAPVPKTKTATALSTQQKMKDVQLTPEAAEKLLFIESLEIEDEISDEEALQRAGHEQINHVDGYLPKKPNTELAIIETLPTKINKEIEKHALLEPEWHQVKHLPGYLRQAIRAIGRQVFRPFTTTIIEDIQVIANVGSGPNTMKEMKAVATWLIQHAERDTDGEMHFQRTIPDYDVEYSMYSAYDFTFMIVKDFAGYYIYSWPSSDNKY